MGKGRKNGEEIGTCFQVQCVQGGESLMLFNPKLVNESKGVSTLITESPQKRYQFSQEFKLSDLREELNC